MLFFGYSLQVIFAERQESQGRSAASGVEYHRLVSFGIRAVDHLNRNFQRERWSFQYHFPFVW
jgi:hypothetical protein